MLAHFILKEKLHIFGVVGSVSIVLHAPHEREIESVKQVWHLATEPGMQEDKVKVIFRNICFTKICYIPQLH